MPPPVTPRPAQRFARGQSRRSQAPAGTTDGATDEQKSHGKSKGSAASIRGDASEQFGVIPRFSTRPLASSARTLPPAAETPSRVVAPVADAGYSSVAEDDDVMLLDVVDDKHGWQDDLTLSPKRRRLTESTEPPRSSVVIATETFARPQQPASRFVAGQRFKPPASQSIASRLSNIPSFTTRLAEPRESLSEIPLPDAFSPHRRGDSYVSGGIASVVQHWIIETGQSALHRRRGRSDGINADEFVMTFQITDIVMRHEKLMLVGGTNSQKEKVTIALITSTGQPQPELKPGIELGLREPCWPVTVQGERIIACVEWTVI